MKPLRLEWRLSSSVAGMRLPLHVDALVAYAITEEQVRSGATGNIRELGKNLPLESETRDGLTCWKASALLSQGNAGNDTRLWTKKTDEYDYAQRMAGQQFSARLKVPMKPYEGTIDTQRGQMKNHFQFYSSKHISHFVGFCIGDEDRLLELLSPESGYITTIGARGRSSHGRIASFHIQEDDQALVMWEKRVLPWPADGLKEIEAAYTNPYWAIENRTTSYIDPALLG